MLAEDRKAPFINVRWVDVDKNHGNAEQQFRSRLVARQCNIGPNEETFAATPPIDALKAIVSLAALGHAGRALLVCYVPGAYVYAPRARRHLCLALP